MPRQDLIAIRRGTAAQWVSANPVLASGEQGFETDTNKLKIGDGSTAWNSLTYVTGEGIKTYQTFADLPDATELEDGKAAKVANDPTASNNGYYAVDDGDWIKDAELYVSTVENDNTKAVSGLAVKRNELPDFLLDKDTITSSSEFNFLKSVVDFWVDDESLVIGKEFRLRAMYKNHVSISDRFGIKEITTNTNLWSHVLIGTINWDSLTGLQLYKMPYNGTFLNVLFKIDQIIEIGTDDTYKHKLNVSENPQTETGVQFLEIKKEPLAREILDSQNIFENQQDLYKPGDLLLKDAFVDFWVDDLTVVDGKEFRLRGLYINHASISNRFGIKELTTDTNIWTNAFYTIDWDSLSGFHVFQIPYLTTYLNFLIDVDKVTQVNQDDTLDNILINTIEPKSDKGYTFFRTIGLENQIATSGKSLAILGDSIIMQFSSSYPSLPASPGDHDNQNWASLKAALQVDELINCGIGGATWQDRGDANITAYPLRGTSTGTMSNCLRMLDRLIADESRVTPDIIVMAMGTNNPDNDGNFTTVMGMTFAALEADETYRQTMYGGLRYSLERARRDYPSSEIYVVTPMQSATSGRSYADITAASTAIKEMASRYSCKVFDSASEIGIVDIFENDGSDGRYLSDGVHLNSDGKLKYSKWLSNKILQTYNG